MLLEAVASCGAIVFFLFVISRKRLTLLKKFKICMCLFLLALAVLVSGTLFLSESDISAEGFLSQAVQGLTVFCVGGIVGSVFGKIFRDFA